MTPTCAVYVVSWRSVNRQAWQALLRHLPPEVIVHHSDSGYFLWIELPEGADASALSARALASHISIAPGKMFSTSDSWTSFFRFNTAWGWGEREEQGVKRLGGAYSRTACLTLSFIFLIINILRK
ncbi:GntR family transcriptional regulator [Klebsiella pneumoniae]|uniref:GntR family transcriptional regulator n=1 Tax=Klebsiella pneumoniae TaxID=573 RepID=A0A447S8V7_KLEPN|nr:GntR family transcriptional regulator [Klebsiella pneumoniae]